jgi:hypothetical protein
MLSRLTVETKEETEHFRDILSTVGSLLELPFIQEVFNHMKENPKGYNHKWLRNALLLAEKLGKLRALNDDEQCITAATVMLLETGRQYNSPHPYEDSAAFATVFLHRHASHFFSLDDMDLITRCCRQIKHDNIRVSVNTKVALVVRETLLLTDVVFMDLVKVVISFVKENVSSNVARVPSEEWRFTLAERFARRYGKSGSVWRGLHQQAAIDNASFLDSFKEAAEDRTQISEIIGNNYALISTER